MSAYVRSCERGERERENRKNRGRNKKGKNEENGRDMASNATLLSPLPILLNRVNVFEMLGKLADRITL